MNKIKTLLALATLLAVTTPASAGTKKIGTINGIDIYRVRTWSLTCPTTTTIIAADPKQPGTFSVINAAAGQGVVPSAANAGGLVGAAALLRPARSETTVNGGNVNTSVTGGNTTSTGGQFVPPGHINNPGNGH